VIDWWHHSTLRQLNDIRLCLLSTVEDYGSRLTYLHIFHIYIFFATGQVSLNIVSFSYVFGKQSIKNFAEFIIFVFKWFFVSHIFDFHIFWYCKYSFFYDFVIFLSLWSLLRVCFLVRIHTSHIHDFIHVNLFLFI